MKTNGKSWNVDTINRRKQKINPKPQYQRGAVWSEHKKQLLIDTMLRGYDVPKIYLRESSDSEYEHEVVDGQQRFRAIWEFLDNEFPLGDSAKDLPAGDLSGIYYDGLDSSTKDELGLYEFSIVIVEDCSDLEIRDLFLRLQEGVTLNPAEKRNAMPGRMRDFVAELSGHPVFGHVYQKNQRFEYDDWSAHVTCLELNGGPTDIKAANLRKMYEDNQSFDPEGPVARKIKRVFNYMEKVLKDDPPEMKIKWGFVDLYLAISSLLETHVLKGREVELAQFFRGLEAERGSVEDPADLLESSDQWDKDLYDYIQAFQTSGAVRKNIETRHRVYLRRIFRDLPDLVAKDDKRNFCEDERVVIWRRDLGKCQKCGVEVKFNEMHADHIKPHSRGGQTTIDNAQTLCGPCNVKKGAS